MALAFALACLAASGNEARAAGFSTPTFTPTPSPATPTSTATAVPTVAAHATSTTAPAATSSPTVTPIPTASPTTPPPATPTFTFTAGPKVTSTAVATATTAPATSTAAPTSTQIPTFSPTPPPPPGQGGVVINEVLTNPVQSTGGAWAELYNPGDASVSLGDWQVTPSLQLLPAGQTIAPHGYLVVSLANSQGVVRQATISLLDPNRAVIDSVTPPPLLADQSYARLPDGSGSWVVSDSPSPGEPNVSAPAPGLEATVFALETQIAAPLPGPPAAPVFDDGSFDATDVAEARHTRTRKGLAFQTLPISAIRGLPDDTPVITSGVVTLPTGLWDAQRAYIQAGGAGILVHSFGATPLHLGDALAIKGRVHHFRGEVEIAAVKGGEQVAPGGALPSARGIQVQDVGGGTEALLVQISGSVSAMERDYVTIGSDSGSARVFLYSKLGLGAKALKAGDSVSVTGVVNAAESSAPASARGYAQRVLTATHRLLPRAAGDVLVSGVPLGPLPAGSRPATGRPPAARSTAETGTNASATPAEASAATSTPTAFVTPVLSSRRAAGGAAEATPTAENVLVLRRPAASGPPGWLWLAGGAGIAAAAAGAVVAIRRRRAGADRQP